MLQARAIPPWPSNCCTSRKYSPTSTCPCTLTGNKASQKSFNYNLPLCYQVLPGKVNHLGIRITER